MVNNNTQIYKKKQPLNKKLAKSLVFWVFIGLFLGVLFGTMGSFHSPDNPSVFTQFFYDFSVHSKEYTIDPFIKGLKLLMGPIIFLTIITGIIRLEDLKTLGSLGFKPLFILKSSAHLPLLSVSFLVRLLSPGMACTLILQVLMQQVCKAI
ncbi:MAG: cation:dicarboxylase symporter family transporter [Helicobacter sp.]|nr:cation:dicarboxylase symporter family transporter [Helicobacter sp.]MDY5951441.1 cation:dicarboxylase symporter family transporter [Helicobacter sp.]